MPRRMSEKEYPQGKESLAADINSVRQAVEAPMPRRMPEEEHLQGTFDTMMAPPAADIEERNHTR